MAKLIITAILVTAEIVATSHDYAFKELLKDECVEFRGIYWQKQNINNYVFISV